MGLWIGVVGGWVGGKDHQGEGTEKLRVGRPGLGRDSRDTLEGGSLLEPEVRVGAASPMSPVLLACGKGVGQRLSIAFRFSCLLSPSREPSRVDGTVAGSGSDTDLQSTGR